MPFINVGCSVPAAKERSYVTMLAEVTFYKDIFNDSFFWSKNIQ